MSEISIYQNKDNKIQIDVQFENETVWLSQAQLVELYQSSKANVSEHIKHIFEEQELARETVVRKCRITASDAKIPARVGICNHYCPVNIFFYF